MQSENCLNEFAVLCSVRLEGLNVIWTVALEMYVEAEVYHGFKRCWSTWSCNWFDGLKQPSHLVPFLFQKWTSSKFSMIALSVCVCTYACNRDGECVGTCFSFNFMASLFCKCKTVGSPHKSDNSFHPLPISSWANCSTHTPSISISSTSNSIFAISKYRDRKSMQICMQSCQTRVLP